MATRLVALRNVAQYGVVWQHKAVKYYMLSVMAWHREVGNNERVSRISESRLSYIVDKHVLDKTFESQYIDDFSEYIWIKHSGRRD